MAQFKVTAPYVTLKIKDAISGGVNVLGYYKGAIVDGDILDGDNLQHHLDKGMVEEFAGESEDVEAAEADHAEEEAEFAEVMAGNADGVKSWVGEDRERANRALAAEAGPDGKNRSGLLGHLEDVASRPDDGDDD